MFRSKKGRSVSSSTPAASVRKSPIRIFALKLVLLAFFLVVGLRLVQIQVVEASVYQEVARRQYEAKVVLPATRGNIYDTNGKILVSNTSNVSFGVDPKIVGHDAPAVAERFSRVFGGPSSVYLKKISAPDKRFVWLKRRTKPAYAKRINAREFDGLIQLNEPQRIYHFGHIAAQVIGFTNVDNNGLTGAELRFDDHLRGTDGYVIMQRDGLGRKRPSVDYPRVKPVSGNSIVLTLDLECQAIAEEELRKGVERNNAESGLVVMIDPTNGEILAMANYPPVNLDNASGTDHSLMRNRIITDMFEPGSLFKIVTASAALEHDLVSPNQKFFAENGRYVVQLGHGKSRTINDIHEYGTITFQDAMELSSNIVMAKISDLIGVETLYLTARNFGFGTETGVELPGEVSGELKKPNHWSGTTLNSMAYGYEVGVTPLQIALAYAAVANRGILMKPHILKRVLNKGNEVVAETRSQVIRQVISTTTAQMLTRFIVGVVERGTGVSAKVNSVSVAGKTGTSRKFVDGKYERGSYTASFAGFFPAEDPRIVCVVMLDNPRMGGYTGGVASAPIFGAITEKVITTCARLAKKSNGVIVGKQAIAVPDVRSLKADIAVEVLTSQGFGVETLGDGEFIVGQSPAPPMKLLRHGLVRLTTNDADAIIPDGYTVVPDVRGMTIRRAMNQLAIQQLDINIDGSGIVVEQEPRVGQRVKIGARVSVRCQPRDLSLLTFH
jgi:cell division protein FtsI (penicillin-binding protein 3)